MREGRPGRFVVEKLDEEGEVDDAEIGREVFLSSMIVIRTPITHLEGQLICQ